MYNLYSNSTPAATQHTPNWKVIIVALPKPDEWHEVKDFKQWSELWRQNLEGPKQLEFACSLLDVLPKVAQVPGKYSHNLTCLTGQGQQDRMLEHLQVLNLAMEVALSTREQGLIRSQGIGNHAIRAVLDLADYGDHKCAGSGRHALAPQTGRYQFWMPDIFRQSVEMIFTFWANYKTWNYRQDPALTISRKMVEAAIHSQIVLQVLDEHLNDPKYDPFRDSEESRMELPFWQEEERVRQSGEWQNKTICRALILVGSAEQLAYHPTEIGYSVVLGLRNEVYYDQYSAAIPFEELECALLRIAVALEKPIQELKYPKTDY